MNWSTRTCANNFQTIFGIGPRPCFSIPIVPRITYFMWALVTVFSKGFGVPSGTFITITLTYSSGLNTYSYYLPWKVCISQCLWPTAIAWVPSCDMYRALPSWRLGAMMRVVKIWGWDWKAPLLPRWTTITLLQQPENILNIKFH